MGGYGFLQWLGADPFEWTLGGQASGDVALATVGNPNFSGGFLGVALPVCVGLVWLDRRHRVTAAVCLAVMVGGWYAADSQGGWGAGLTGTALMAGFLLAPKWRLARPAGAVIAVLTVVVGIASVVWAVNAPDNGVTSETVLWRGWWWQAAADMAGDSPVWGHGPNVFAYEGAHYRVADEAAALNYNFADDPHSVFMSFVANAGAIGALGFLILIAWVCRTGFRVPVAQPWAAVWLGAVAAYFAQAFVSIDELTLRLGLWTALGGLAASMAPRPARAKPSRARRRRRPRRDPLDAWPAVGALALVVLVTAWWGINLMVADAKVLSGQSAFAQDRPEEAQDDFDSALGFRDDNNYRSAYGYELGQVALASKPEGREYIEDSGDAYSYLDDFPDISGLVNYARILHSYAEAAPELEDEALVLYRRAIEHDPLNPLIRVETSDVLNSLGRNQEAVATLDAVFETGADYAEYWGALAVSHAALGNTEYAQIAIDSALVRDPNEGRAQRAQEILEGSS
jgi:tetratricopeptide (TPR) repeat protein